MLSPRPPAAHILAYAQTLEGGGVERTLLRLARRWSEAGRRVTLLLGDAGGPLAREIPADVSTCILGTTSMLGMRALAQATRDLAPDLLFCPGNHYTGLAAWTRLRLGRRCPPIVAKVSNTLVRRDQSALVAPIYRAWLRCHPAFVDGLVSMSPAMALEARQAMRAYDVPLRVIPNPPVARARGCVPPPIPAGRYLIGVGRLAPQKRWDRLIAAFVRVADRRTTLTILGEGPARGALEGQVAALGLTGRVLLPGHVADPAPAIARAAALALVSDFEGVPGVLREALAVGTPVVTTDSSVAVREIVTGPSLGSVVPFDDAGALASALDHWLTPGRARPHPVPEPGRDAAEAYLELFDRVVLDRRARQGATGAASAKAATAIAAASAATSLG